MKKNKFLYIGIFSFLILLLVAVLMSFKFKQNSDAIKFKNEYEALNDTVRESDGATYNSVSIPKDNPIKYINSKEAIKIIEKDDAIIYVGAEWCPWCRNAVTVLFEIADKYDVQTIYYLNLDDEKSSYEVKDGKLVNTVKGSKDYYKLLDKLSDILSYYVLTDNEGNKYDTKEKRIYMPHVIAVHDGKIVSDHVGTVTLNEDQDKYSAFTKDQHKELYNTYDEMFSLVYGEVKDDKCNLDELCD